MPNEPRSVEEFAQIIYDLNKSDRDSLVVCSGFTGVGKSTFLIKVQKAYAKISKTKWSLDHLTWSREEMLKWIDGDQKGKGQKPIYSAILVDELISLFFRRNWYENEQKVAIELLNKCRDRRLFIGGNIPSFWDLDGSFTTRVRFYVYLPRGRSRAWIFEQEDNPFSNDVWNTLENKKKFRTKKNPFTCANFLCEINFGDLSAEEKKDYLHIRNTKRRNTENQVKKNTEERYGIIKRQRDELIKLCLNKIKGLQQKDLADVIGISKAAIGMIYNGLR